MERMTHIDNKGWYVGDQSFPFDERRRGEVVDRPAAYEDTGLEPKQARIISNVLCEVGETYNCWFDYVVNCVLKNSHLKDLAQAEKDGRLEILPPNDPLTLEQLRGMEKEPEPIYITGLGWKICYGIEDCFGRPALKVGVTARIYLDNYGEGFVAYRRKPKEGTA